MIMTIEISLVLFVLFTLFISLFTMDNECIQYLRLAGVLICDVYEPWGTDDFLVDSDAEKLESPRGAFSSSYLNSNKPLLKFCLCPPFDLVEGIHVVTMWLRWDEFEDPSM